MTPPFTVESAVDPFVSFGSGAWSVFGAPLLRCFGVDAFGDGLRWIELRLCGTLEMGALGMGSITSRLDGPTDAIVAHDAVRYLAEERASDDSWTRLRLGDVCSDGIDDVGR